jgi:2-succinyl-6-hydroxy-2,4-cyclohexadiene-1-carboxylate synthase
VPETVVLLHGFGGTRRAWDGVLALLDAERYSPLALDLPGHGLAADAERPITFPATIAAVLRAAPERFTLCGYSMGGRIALHAALAAPDRVQRLVLVSSTAGIEDPQQRAARRRADGDIADGLERGPLEQFIERWRAQPLFAADPPEVDRLAREDQLRNRPDALAAALRGIGTGEMQDVWARLGELAMPVTVLAGERDRRFVTLGRRISELVPRGELLVVPGGHRLALENPRAVADALATDRPRRRSPTAP